MVSNINLSILNYKYVNISFEFKFRIYYAGLPLAPTEDSMSKLEAHQEVARVAGG